MKINNSASKYVDKNRVLSVLFSVFYIIIFIPNNIPFFLEKVDTQNLAAICNCKINFMLNSPFRNQ